MGKHSDLWDEFDKIDSWHERIKEAEQHLTNCRLDYHLAFTNTDDMAKIVELLGKHAEAETQVIRLYDERRKYIGGI